MSGYHERTTTSTTNLEITKRIHLIHGNPEQMGLFLEDLREMLREGLLSLCTAAGLSVLQTLMEADVAALAGPKGKHLPDRKANRHGTERTSVVLGGQKIGITRPRVRTCGEEGKELPIPTYEAVKQDDPLVEAALARMLHGLSSRDYKFGGDEPGAGCQTKGTSKSSVSRRFIKATEAELNRLLRREIGELGICVLLIDGVQFSKHNVIVCMGIDGEGRKHVLGLKIAATENVRACKDLLRDLVDRGLNADNGLLAIIDGSKALKSALKATFEDQVLIQRCQVHKLRNVTDYLPTDQQPLIRRQMRKAWALDNAEESLRSLRSLATRLEENYPDAAASLREGLEETVTVQRLAISGLLRKTLSTTNTIESAFDIVRDRTGNVKHWKSGSMVKRWVGAALLEAETRFRRIKGYRDMPMLRAEIRRLTVEKQAETSDEVAIGSKTA